ncbi:PHD finger protein ALFIN-LIKE 4 [Datura stramonium]|uniref:PHD finger protein ALFIN-LIKE n=1 Tax=Datura stramonium TaxID=4076 RepID=A0ABS8RJL4_DATST|nr:PHD finger protein ALFIN-LIKE 4 [Datura stramonium]
MEGGAKGQNNNSKPLDVFNNFKGRYAALIKALTTDVEEFFKQCDPEKENLCLYGLPNEQWVVNLPAEDLPPGLPEPVLGINFARDGMQQKEWLSFVSYHSDAWLLAVAFYVGAGLSKAERKRLFDMINDLPTIHEVVTGVQKKQQKEKSAVSNQSKKKSKSNTSKRASESRGKFTKSQQKYEEEEDYDEDEEEEEDGWDIVKDGEEEQGETLCGACGEKYADDEFWICCDHCEKWYHGQCVKITAAAAEFIKQYKCPPCKRYRK